MNRWLSGAQRALEPGLPSSLFGDMGGFCFWRPEVNSLRLCLASAEPGRAEVAEDGVGPPTLLCSLLLAVEKPI